MGTPGTDDEAELLAAVTELGSALRELVDASVTTSVGPGVRAGRPTPGRSRRGWRPSDAPGVTDGTAGRTPS